MAVISNPRFTCFWCRCSRLILAIAWIFGLVFGFLLSSQASSYLIPLMRSADFSRVSIVSLLTALLFPLFCSAIAIYLSAVWLLPCLAFIKGFLFTFLMNGVLAAIGWNTELCFMLMLCDACAHPMLVLYWFRHVSGEHRFQFRTLLPAAFTAVLISLFSFFIDSPFLANLFR